MSIYGPEYDALNALSLKLNEWDTAVRKAQMTVGSKRPDVDEAFQGTLDRLCEAMGDVGFVMNTIKEEYEDNERLLEYEASRHGKSAGHGVSYQPKAAE